MVQVGYSKKVMEHFMNPRNVGVIENLMDMESWKSCMWDLMEIS